MDKITQEFNYLRLHGKIKKIEHVKASNVRNFSAGKFKKVIKYNPNMNLLGKTEIDFCLLHEEGHYANPIKLIHITYIVLFLIIYLALSANIIIATIFLFLACCCWSIGIYQNYEYKADDYACNYFDELPNIKSVFEKIDSMQKKDMVHKIGNIGSKLSHPSAENRIKRIENHFN